MSRRSRGNIARVCLDAAYPRLIFGLQRLVAAKRATFSRASGSGAGAGAGNRQTTSAAFSACSKNESQGPIAAPKLRTKARGPNRVHLSPPREGTIQAPLPRASLCHQPWAGSQSAAIHIPFSRTQEDRLASGGFDATRYSGPLNLNVDSLSSNTWTRAPNESFGCR